MHSTKYTLCTLATVLLLSACDPDYLSTADLCANIPESPVSIGVSDFSVSAGTSDYKLYLEDILFAYEPADESTLTTDQLAARDFVDAKLASYLDYTVTNEGVVTQANNPLDFIEELIATTDAGRTIGVFEEAKEKMARAIAADDDFCSYTNRNIVVENTTTSENLYVDFDTSYNPFTRIVQQSVLITQSQEALLSARDRATAPFVGFFQANPDDFQVSGYTPPYLRQAIMNDASKIESFSIDDGFDTRLGVMEFIIQDEICYPNDEAESPEDLQACDAGVTTRPVHPDAAAECSGEDGKIAQNFFYINDNFPQVKRLRVETDYVTQEVRVYVSEYIEAIENADGSRVINDPTDCEKQAILDQLAEANPDTTTGVRLTVVEDPEYDVIFEGEGENRTRTEPTPNDIGIYQGQAIPARQEEI